VRIGLTFDIRSDYPRAAGDPADAAAEFDHPDTIRAIEQAIEAAGHTVVRIGNAEALLKVIDRLEVDGVFNIAEGLRGRNRESQVPVLLEMRGIPVVGADGLTQAVTLDKAIAKKLFLAEGIPTPCFFTMAAPTDPIPAGWTFPAIVKPRFEGSSKGLSESSRVLDEAALRAQAARVIRDYRQPVIVEQFIRGNEFTVAIIGNETPEIFLPVRVMIDGRAELGDLFYTFSRIASGADYACPAGISETLSLELQRLALAAYRAVDCVDFGRVDFRVDEQGRPFVLEINPLPSLSTLDVFGILAGHLEVPHAELIQRILQAGIRRWGLETARPAGGREAAGGRCLMSGQA